MQWDKVDLVLPDGRTVAAQAPVIISASRATDIPAFYADWFVERWKAGYARWRNPFNRTDVYVAFCKTRAVVFWTKDPRAMMRNWDFLAEHVPNFYFQFTLNDYEREGLEPYLPGLDERIRTFASLSSRIGRERLVWRWDPLLLCASVDELLRRVRRVGDQVSGRTDRLVFSFADIAGYGKVSRNMAGIPYHEFSEADMLRFAEGLCRLNEQWGLRLGTCAERIDLSEFGIEHNKCVDDRLMADAFGNDPELMNFLGVQGGGSSPVFTKVNRDRGQRPLCLCAPSKDIGMYNSCPHGCVYCYANISALSARKRYAEFGGRYGEESIG